MSRAFLAGAAAGATAVWAYGFLRSRFYDDDDETSSDETSSDEEPSPQRRRRARRLRWRRAVQDAADFQPGLYKLSSKTGELKSVKMSPGKAAAQSGHATLGAYRRGMRRCPNAVRDWLRIGQMKITVKCPTVQELLELQEKCAAAGLNCYLIRDAGHTEIEPGSRTVLAVGPAPASAMDPLTRHLKPY